jgi:hypothetical protein
MMFLDCPAWLDEDGAAGCGLPAEVRRRFITRSTGGPLENSTIRIREHERELPYSPELPQATLLGCQ